MSKNSNKVQEIIKLQIHHKQYSHTNICHVPHTYTHKKTYITTTYKELAGSVKSYPVEVVKEKNVPHLEAYDFCTSFISDMPQSLGMLNLSRKREKTKKF